MLQEHYLSQIYPVRQQMPGRSARITQDSNLLLRMPNVSDIYRGPKRTLQHCGEHTRSRRCCCWKIGYELGSAASNDGHTIFRFLS